MINNSLCKYIPVVFLFFIVSLSSCSIDWNNEKDKEIASLKEQNFEKDKKIASLQEQTEKDIFRKKQECSAFEEKLTSKFNNEAELWIGFRVLNAVFYSKSRNTCFAIIWRSIRSWNQVSVFKDIRDMLWGDESSFDMSKPEGIQGYNSLLKKLEE